MFNQSSTLRTSYLYMLNCFDLIFRPFRFKYFQTMNATPRRRNVNSGTKVDTQAEDLASSFFDGFGGLGLGVGLVSFS